MKKPKSKAAVAAHEPVVIEPEANVAVAEPESTPATPSVVEILERQKRESEQVLLASEEVLMMRCEQLAELKSAGYRLPLPPEELSLLSAAGYETDHNSLVVQLARRDRIKKLMKTAGSGTERAAARQAANEAAEAEAARRPKLEQIIAEAERELATLEEATRTATEKAGAMEGAVASLRDPKIMPKWMQDRAACSPEMFEARAVRLRIIKLKNERNSTLVIEGVPSTSNEAVLHARAAGLDHLVYQRDGRDAVIESGWRDYKEGRLASLPRIEAEIDELEHKRTELLAVAQSSDFYVDRLPA